MGHPDPHDAEKLLAHTIFWDVDTQNDFMMPEGKLYIQGAEEILPNLSRLTDFARRCEIPILGSVDYHSLGDPEISSDPDFEQTFPPHCMRETSGQLKVEATEPRNPYWVDNEAGDPDALRTVVDAHRGELFFRKQEVDVFANQNLDSILEQVSPGRIILYGVALDVCNACAINGFLERDTVPVSLVLDATKAIIPERGEELVSEWRKLGVDITDTATVISTDF